jgi:hypothetical protein
VVVLVQEVQFNLAEVQEVLVVELQKMQLQEQEEQQLNLHNQVILVLMDLEMLVEII